MWILTVIHYKESSVPAKLNQIKYELKRIYCTKNYICKCTVVYCQSGNMEKNFRNCILIFTMKLKLRNPIDTKKNI